MHNPTTHHLTRHATRLAVVALVVVVARVLCGPWPTAIVLAAIGLVWGLRTWCRLERRTRPAPRTVEVVTARRDTVLGGHVAFARALAVVTAAYLAECEREARS
jgi:hypothetical protein